MEMDVYGNKRVDILKENVTFAQRMEQSSKIQI